jgi:hypothetical protein
MGFFDRDERRGRRLRRVWCRQRGIRPTARYTIYHLTTTVEEIPATLILAEFTHSQHEAWIRQRIGVELA